ncbi:hypothetical protein ES703_62517 [subsurface metagenome]
MRAKKIFLVCLATIVFLGLSSSLFGATGKKLGEGIVIYAQMGGIPGGASTLPRHLGAKIAEEQWGCEVHYQFSEWQSAKMIAQFKEAIAAGPDGIVVCGHPGVEPFKPFVEEAQKMGIIVTTNNVPLPELEERYMSKGFGYIGMDLYDAGYLLGSAVAEIGKLKGKLEEEDKVLVYGLASLPTRGLTTRGNIQAFEDAGLKVDYLEISREVDSDASLGVPVLTAYLISNPDCKALIIDHGMVTGIAEDVLKAAELKPGDIVVGGTDLSPKTVAALLGGYIQAAQDQQIFLQGYLPITQICLTKLFKISGLHTNTGYCIVTEETIHDLIPLIEEGYR